MSFTCNLMQVSANLCVPNCMLTHVRKSRTVLDSTLFRILDFQFLLVELGFRIPDPDSGFSCIPDCKAQDSGFHLNILLDLGFQNPDSLTGKKNGLWTDFLYYNRTTSLHVQRTLQLTSEYHY